MARQVAIRDGPQASSNHYFLVNPEKMDYFRIQTESNENNED